MKAKLTNWGQQEYKPRPDPRKFTLKLPSNPNEKISMPIRMLHDIIINSEDAAIKRIYQHAVDTNQINDSFLIHLIRDLIQKRPFIELIIPESVSLKCKVRKYKNKYLHSQRAYVMMKNKYEALKKRLEAQNSEEEEIEAHEQQEETILKTIQDFYQKQLLVQAQNSKIDCQRPSYPRQLYPFYVLLSFIGEHWYNILKIILGLPSFRSVQNYRNQMLKEHGLDDIKSFDGQVQLIKNLMNSLWVETGSDNRCVLAIDAASINPQIQIKSNGVVTGFVSGGPSEVTVTEAEKLRNSASEYKKFVKKNLKYVSKYEFVVLLCPLDPLKVPFPISVVEARSGTATKDTKNSLDSLRKNAVAAGLDVIGYAFDGDRQYLDLSDDFINEDLLNTVFNESSKNIHELWAEEDFLFLYYDLLHLVKCDRYRKSKKKHTHVWPTCEGEATISPGKFVEMGIPEHLFDDSLNSKMHDHLPVQLFTPEHCRDPFEQEQYDLWLSLLPSTYLLESVMNHDLTRAQRLNYLTIGFCIMVLFYDDLLNRKSSSQESSKVEGHDYTLFNFDYAKKYLALAWSLSHPVMDGNCVKLGSLGTHLLEHFFGSNRRINRGNDTASNFVRTIQFQMLSAIIQKQMNLNITQPKRQAESGAVLKETTESIDSISIQKGLVIAARIINFSSAKDCWGDEIIRARVISLEDEVGVIDDDELFSFFPQITREYRQTVPSLRSIGAANVGGLSNLSRYSRHRQVDMIDDDEWIPDEEEDSDYDEVDYDSDEEDEYE